MRDIKRIAKVTGIIHRLWETHFPDLRFGQLMIGFQDYVRRNTGTEFFYIEDDEMVSLLYNYFIFLKSYR